MAEVVLEALAFRPTKRPTVHRLLQQVDRTALEAVAQVSETHDASKIALREGQGLDDLELALLPVLPVESVRVQKV